MNILNIAVIALQLIVLFFTVYQTSISILGFVKEKKKKPISTKYENTFAVIVCAHNEERVVGQIVENLLSLNYPKDMYDVYVIADNCTDNTAAIVREKGGIAMERHDATKRGKGFALEWMFDYLWKQEENGLVYDAVVVLDADNLVTKNFLQVMNDKLQNGYEIAQAYLDTKNPDDTWVTKSYAFSYWSTNRIFQNARDVVGLSAQLGGTGMMISRNILKDIGWGTESLTEDLEFTAKYILETGKPVAWAHDAKIYDEKPLELVASMKQRLRWMIGHINCMFKFFVPMLKAAIKKESLLHFDMAMYLVQPTKTVLGISHLLFIMSSIFQWYDFYIISHWIWIPISLISYIIIPVIGLIKEKHGKKAAWLILAYFYGLTWIPVTIAAFINRKEREWSHTKHDRTLSQDEIERIQL
ncbi:glycosyltransferase family 2 protein [Fredinandcohnia humi]